jgi:hypothetical protein
MSTTTLKDQTSNDEADILRSQFPGSGTLNSQQCMEEKIMQSDTQIAPESKKGLWTGRILSAVVVLFLLFNGAIGLMRPPFAVQGFVHLGYPAGATLPVATLLIVCALLYAIPRTAVLGAVLLTGYLGGATASHVRIGEPFFLPMIVGALVWAGLFLREDRLRVLVPLGSTRTASISKTKLWSGRIISALAVLFMLVDAAFKLVKPLPVPVAQAFERLGYPTSLAAGIGILVLACTAIYVIPRTSVLGTLLLTGYLGGATAIQVRAGSPLFETLFPVIFAVLVWAGVFLREDRLRALIPVRR